MVKPARSRTVAAATALAVLAVPVTLLAACTPNQPPATTPGTTPSVWTGAPAPPKTPPEGGPVPPESITTHLRAPDGTLVATAKFEFDPGYVTITVRTTGLGQLTPGFHGLHIHAVGKCEPNSVAPTGGPPGDFLSAGGHYQAPGHTGEPESGDLTSLQVRRDGAALLVTTTDAFTKEDLLSKDKTAIIIHAGPDNFANIPPERYTQANGTPGPDAMTKSTGDAGKRVACGVIGSG
ncbi:superoxide dismutase [Mycobacterium heckeshornense]|uniref:superoxide dismutase[Cu-Zn] n=1 Tax=Mycobacterium heckeshornense TaxID=110505 RepID=UPI000662B421|nr:superoxide dismutase family protein [Mycobacterium heckeshornense]KMV24411.1 superoxide dismutase [Mycobacterium heckeshornense]MCV7035470.1 superoxide dismutase family protein [Mycobacterium heckeshornense]PIJ37958.1 superoxide dismutase [Mycobacterium heckeshornense]